VRANQAGAFFIYIKQQENMDREQLLQQLQQMGLPSGLADFIDLTKINSEGDLKNAVKGLIKKPATVDELLADDSLKVLANQHADKRVTEGIKKHDETRREKEKQQNNENPNDVPAWFKEYQKQQDEKLQTITGHINTQTREAKIEQNKKRLEAIATAKKMKPDLLKLVVISDTDTDDTITEKVKTVIETVGENAIIDSEDPTIPGRNPRTPKDVKQTTKSISEAFNKEVPIKTDK
jgi:hypothetical protein